MPHMFDRTSLLPTNIALAISLVACGTPSSTETDGASDSSGSDGLTSLESTTNNDTTGDGDGDGEAEGDGDGDGDGEAEGDGDGDRMPGECGNGIHEFGEECDDGNLLPDDSCDPTCNWEEGPLPCGSQTYQCGDEIDNDMDGLADMDDPECISPCDDSESSFETDIPGQNEDCNSDCFWDGDSGFGNDQCQWNLMCDPENPGAEIGCEYDPDYGPCEPLVSDVCLEVCVPAVPNGCDCFGCCEIDGQFVYLAGAECALDNLDACQGCTFFEECNNPCEPEICEVCFGDDPNELPEECDEPACPEELEPCQNSAECVEGFFCQTGCCVPIVVE
jgi:hypothetical protein